MTPIPINQPSVICFPRLGPLRRLRSLSVVTRRGWRQWSDGWILRRNQLEQSIEKEIGSQTAKELQEGHKEILDKVQIPHNFPLLVQIPHNLPLLVQKPHNLPLLVQIPHNLPLLDCTETSQPSTTCTETSQPSTTCTDTSTTFNCLYRYLTTFHYLYRNLTTLHY